jgi:holo-[acyl-carrier protein] synthase
MAGTDLTTFLGGFVIGIGTDIVEVDRIRGVLERQGKRFLDRVFTDEERKYCERMKFPHKHYAARFAAKEAVSKAFTTGIGGEFSWKSASIYHGARNHPLVRLDEQGTRLLHQIGGTRVVVSLSHTETNALAVAAILRE